MGLITDAFDSAFRDFSTDGVPSSGAHKPRKADIRALSRLFPDMVTVSGYGLGLAAALSYCAANGRPLLIDAVYDSLTSLSVTCDQPFPIFGLGPNFSGIRFTTTDGGLTINCTGSTVSARGYHLADFGLYAKAAGVGPVALKLTYASSPGTIGHSSYISNVPVTFAPGFAASSNYWLNGYDFDGVDDAVIVAAHLMGQPSGYSGFGIRVNKCNPAPQLMGGHVYNFDKGYTNVGGADDSTEGGKIFGTIFVACNYGVYLDFSAEGGSPGFQVIGSHCNTAKGAVYLNSCNQYSVAMGAYYKRPDSTQPYTDIEIVGGSVGTITGNKGCTNNGTGASAHIKLRSTSKITIDGSITQAGRDIGIDWDESCSDITIDAPSMNLRTCTAEASFGGVTGLLRDIIGSYGQATCVYGGITFDGATNYFNTNPLTGITDSKKGTFFATLRFATTKTGAGTDEFIVNATGGRIRIARTSTGQIHIMAGNSAGTTILDVTTNVLCAAAGVYSILASWDLATANSVRVWVNEAVGQITYTTFTNDTIDYTTTTWAIGATTAGINFFTGDIYSLWFSELVNLEFHKGSVRRNFVGSDLTPVFLGARGERPTGSIPILFHAYDKTVASWSVQRGAATSAWTLTGTFAVATTLLWGEDSIVDIIQADARGIGYAVGNGGTITQITSKATGVTLNKPSGEIVTSNAALASATKVSFALTNSCIALGDIVTVMRKSGGTAASYRVWAEMGGSAGACTIFIENYSGGSLSEALTLQFGIIKGQVS